MYDADRTRSLELLKLDEHVLVFWRFDHLLELNAFKLIVSCAHPHAEMSDLANLLVIEQQAEFHVPLEVL